MVGERPTAARLNTTIRDNMAALMSLGSTLSLLNPCYATAAWLDRDAHAITPPFVENLGFGGNTDEDLHNSLLRVVAQPEPLINMDTMNALNFAAGIKWRMQTVFNVATAAAGATGLIWYPRVWVRAIATVASSLTAGTSTRTIGAGSAIVNSTGYKAADSGWWNVDSLISGSGQYVLEILWRSERTGGSAGVVDKALFYLEFRLG